MPPTTPCRRGDIVLVPFPFTDLSTTKQRPAVVLSSERYHQVTGDCLVAAITSIRPPSLLPVAVLLMACRSCRTFSSDQWNFVWRVLMSSARWPPRPKLTKGIKVTTLVTH